LTSTLPARGYFKNRQLLTPYAYFEVETVFYPARG
jgi:hypothetical protein